MRVEAGAAAVEPEREKALKAAQGFEAVFLKELLKLAMPSGNREESVYGDCLADALSREAAGGRGLGLAGWMMENGLKSGGKLRIT